MEQVEQTQEIRQEEKAQGKKLPFLVAILIILIFGVSLGALFLINNSGAKKAEVESAKQVKNLPDKTSVTVKNVPAVIASEIALEITSPQTSITVNTSSVLVQGKTLPLADVFVNDTETKADNLGRFSVNLILDEGDNDITVLANDSVGNYAEKELIVSYEPL